MKTDQQSTGELYLVPSPLGNLGDLTLRAVETLKMVDLVLAEDTRRTLKLLNHLGLRKTLQSYRAQNHHRVWPKIADILARGERVALVTDAGSPVVSDPGAALAAACRQAGFPLISLPGPSAVTCALAASGFSGDRFVFGGFLPARSSQRRTFLLTVKSQPWTLIFFESPHRLLASLRDMADILGPRPAVLAREMTKIHEEYLSGSLLDLILEVEARPRKGEMTLVVAGRIEVEEEPPLDLEYLRDLALNDSRPLKVLAAELALDSGRGRGEFYRLLLEFRQQASGNL